LINLIIPGFRAKNHSLHEDLSALIRIDVDVDGIGCGSGSCIIHQIDQSTAIAGQTDSLVIHASIATDKEKKSME
jgi:hypothetical protein